MKYLNARLSEKQKTKLRLLISNVDIQEIKLHDWILGEYGSNDLGYVKPLDRSVYIEYKPGSLINRVPVTCVDVWKLLEIIGTDIPVDGVELIKYINAIAASLDVIYKETN